MYLGAESWRKPWWDSCVRASGVPILWMCTPTEAGHCSSLQHQHVTFPRSKPWLNRISFVLPFCMQKVRWPQQSQALHCHQCTCKPGLGMEEHTSIQSTNTYPAVSHIFPAYQGDQNPSQVTRSTLEVNTWHLPHADIRAHTPLWCSADISFRSTLERLSIACQTNMKASNLKVGNLNSQYFIFSYLMFGDHI